MDKKDSKAIIQFLGDLQRGMEGHKMPPQDLTEVLERTGPIALEIEAGAIVYQQRNLVSGGAWTRLLHSLARAGVIGLTLTPSFSSSSARRLGRVLQGSTGDLGLTLVEEEIPGLAVRLSFAEPTKAIPSNPPPLDPCLEQDGADPEPWATPAALRSGKHIWRVASHLVAPEAELTQVVILGASHRSPEDQEEIVHQVISRVETELGRGNLPTVVAVVSALGGLEEPGALELEQAIEQRLSTDPCVDALVRSLDQADLRPSAGTLLRMLGGIDPKQLFSRIALLQSVEGRIALAGLLRERQIDPQTLVASADPDVPATFAVCAMVAARGGHDKAWGQIRDLGLHHIDAPIREATLMAITRLEARQLKGAVWGCLSDPHPEVRKLARDLVVRRGDPEPTGDMAQALSRKDLDVDERRSIYTALGLMGGPTANQALITAFHQEREPELKAAVALAVGNVGHHEGEGFLRDQLSKRNKRVVREAIEDGLERIRIRERANTEQKDLVRELLDHVNRDPEQAAQAANRLRIEEPGASIDAALELGAILETRDLSLPRFRGAVLALAVLGGEVAGEVLRGAYLRTRDSQKRGLIVWALGRVGDASSIAFLSAEARRRLLPPELRQVLQAILQEAQLREGEGDPGREAMGMAELLVSKASLLASSDVGMFARGAALEALRLTTGAIRQSADAIGQTENGMVRTVLAAADAVAVGVSEIGKEDRYADRRHRQLRRKPRLLGHVNLEAKPEETEDAPTDVKDESEEVPDMSHLFPNYVHYLDDEGQHVFGARYSPTMIVDVHTYEVDTAQDAYTSFFRDKVQEGFVPQANLKRELNGDRPPRGLDTELLGRAYLRAQGKQ